MTIGAPLASRVSSRSRIHLAKSSWTSRFIMNISAPTAASPVQPFFSNIGVSVGMPWMLL